MKPKNVKKKLNGRIEEWEKMKADGSNSPKKKTIHKPSGGVLEYTKPGSLQKK